MLAAITSILRSRSAAARYLPPSTFSECPDHALLAVVHDALARKSGATVLIGSTWTTEAPYRETDQAIDYARDLGVLAVEMEAAALPSMRSTRRRAQRDLPRLRRQHDGAVGKGRFRALRHANVVHLEHLDFARKRCPIPTLTRRVEGGWQGVA